MGSSKLQTSEFNISDWKDYGKNDKRGYCTFLESNKLIKDSQHDFRNKKWCLTNLLEFIEKVAKYLDSDEPVDVIYLDFQKAFDKVPHFRPLARLEEIGITGKLLDWIREWLKGRKQRVVINGKRRSGLKQIVVYLKALCSDHYCSLYL